MGVLDIEGKKYLSDNEKFADAFNYLIYDGTPIIKADNLREIDTTEFSVPYGNNAKAPVQRYRDILKLWNAMMDDDAIYVILGAELQDRVHYGMPVKDGVYDMLGYSKQIEEIRRSYSRQGGTGTADGEISVEDGVVRIKLTSEEFLSGLRKGDKLIPIITAVVYLGDTTWDGPRSLHDMLDFKNDELRRFVPDYHLNLISPADMSDDEFSKFHTDFGFAMEVIKHQASDADEIIRRTNHRKIDRDTALFLNSAVKLNLEYEETTGGIDMCLAMEKKQKRDEINGVIKFLRSSGMPESDIISKITETFNVTKEYVMALLTPQKT